MYDKQHVLSLSGQVQAIKQVKLFKNILSIDRV